ncbi:MAG TPA: LLM class flavin-dependent oxidoreductase [Candidatus Dormibacteraeota bacterium]|nr:LLM class flavin-dependent oxidoreductase [Candidatus Dormibacteraeota bacterium]
MKFVLGLTNWFEHWELTKQATVRAEELGFWGLSMPDHYVRSGGSNAGTLDSWIALAHLASRTKVIRVGTMVTPIPLRPPALLAKMVSTVDVLSNGRTFLGVGAGWLEREFEAYSEWDEPSVRVSKTEEGLRLILDLWTKKEVDFNGKYYHAKGGVLEPKPVQRPHPLLLFGGSGRRMLRLAGKYGNIVFLQPDLKLDVADAKKIVLETAKENMRTGKLSFAMGSPMNESGHGPAKYSPERFRQAVSEAEKSGCEYFDFSIPDAGMLESMNDFAKNVMQTFP